MWILLAVLFNYFADKRLKRLNQSFAGERVEDPSVLYIRQFSTRSSSCLLICCRLTHPRFRAHLRHSAAPYVGESSADTPNISI